MTSEHDDSLLSLGMDSTGPVLHSVPAASGADKMLNDDGVQSLIVTLPPRDHGQLTVFSSKNARQIV